MESSSDASSESKADCSICLGPFVDPCSLSLCCHQFCRQCLSQALEVNRHCPKCRGSVEPCDMMNINDASGNAAIRRVQRFGIALIGLTDQRARAQGNNSPSNFRLPWALSPPGVTTQTPAVAQRQGVPAASSANGSTPASPHAVSVAAGPAPTPLPRSTTTRAPRPVSALVPLTPAPLIPVPPVLAPPVLAPAPLPTTAPSVPLISALSSLSVDDNSDDQEAIFEEFLLNQSADRRRSQSLDVRTFSCPYCEEGELDDLDLLDHCNQNHSQDKRLMVCPICVSLPHGNPAQVSRNLIGHLNLRHCYYIHDYTNIDRNDPLNVQDALFESFRVNSQDSA